MFPVTSAESSGCSTSLAALGMAGLVILAIVSRSFIGLGFVYLLAMPWVACQILVPWPGTRPEHPRSGSAEPQPVDHRESPCVEVFKPTLHSWARSQGARLFAHVLSKIFYIHEKWSIVFSPSSCTSVRFWKQGYVGLIKKRSIKRLNGIYDSHFINYHRHFLSSWSLSNTCIPITSAIRSVLFFT